MRPAFSLNPTIVKVALGWRRSGGQSQANFNHALYPQNQSQRHNPLQETRKRALESCSLGGWQRGWGSGGSGAPGPHAHGNAGRQAVDDRRAEVCGQRKPSNDPRSNQHNPRYASYWAPLTHKRHPPQPAQPRHTNDWAPRTRK